MWGRERVGGEKATEQEKHGTQVGVTLLVSFYPFLFIFSLKRETFSHHLSTPQTRDFTQTAQQEGRKEVSFFVNHAVMKMGERDF